MLGTSLVVKVDHIRWHLEALLSSSSQGIDSIDQIFLYRSLRKTTTLDLGGLSDLGISSAVLTVS